MEDKNKSICASLKPWKKPIDVMVTVKVVIGV